MEAPNKKVDERTIVISAIKAANSESYEVLTNLEKDENYIGQIFPDLILLDRKTKLPVFIIEVKKNGNIAHTIQQWKSAASIPATLYIIVPAPDLQSAKSIAEVVGLQTKFGSYQIDSNGRALVKYDS